MPKLSPRMPLEDRLLAKRAIDSETGCWEWQGYRDPQGYGRVNWRAQTPENGVHRIALAIFADVDPGEGLVLHKCNNPPCFNPAHLYVGDINDNYRDMAARGTQVYPPPQPAGAPTRARGERCGSAKLTDAAVRALLQDPRPAHLIAAELGVHKSHVCRIKRGEMWRHITVA